MATPFRLKRSAISGKRPTLNDLQLGELALNTYDAYLYGTRDAGGVGIGTTVTLLTPWTENFGAASIYYENVVGVGTTNPTSKFTVQGDVLITGFSTVRSNFTVAGVTTTQHLRVTGFTTTVNQSITGVATIGTLAVSGVTTSRHLNVAGVATFNQAKLGVVTSYDLIANGDYSNTINLGNDLFIYHITDPLYRANFIHSDEYNLVLGTKSETGGNTSFNVLVGIYTGNDAFSNNTGYVSLNYGNSDTKLNTIGSGITVFGTAFTNQLSVSGVSTLGTGVTITSGGNINAVSGVITATQFVTGAGAGITITNNTIFAPTLLVLDPSPAGVGTTSGVVQIKGDLYVDGTQFIVNSTTIELGDFNIGIATTVGTNALLDGAGLGIGSVSIRKNFTYASGSDSLKSSENFDLASGKVYKINGTEVLSATQLTVANVNAVGVSTLGTLAVAGVTTTQHLNVTGFTTVVNQSITGVATVGSNLAIAGVTTTRHLNVIGFTTVVNQSITGVATVGSNLAVAGVTTSQHLNVTGFTTVVNQSITGVATVGSNLAVAGVTTTQHLNVTGFTTVVNQSITGVATVGSNLAVAGVTTTQHLNVTGFTTVVNQSITGVLTVTNGIQGIGIQSAGSNIATGLITAINFVGAGNSFSYNSGTKTVDINIGGSQWTFVDPGSPTTSSIYRVNGNVGIGTTNPLSKLDLVGDANFTGVVTATTFSGQINSGVGTFTNLTAINATLTNINSSGISTLGVTSVTRLTAQSINSSGIITGSTFRPSTGYIQAADGTNSLYIYSGTGNVAFQGTIGASQINNSQGYKVIGFAGTNNATFENNVYISGITTSVGGFVGNLTGIAASATKLVTPRTFEITGDIVASQISFDGTGNVSLAATIQPNSVGLGTDTTGDYVQAITGTSNQITVTGGIGESSTPILSIPNQFTAPQDVTVTRDLQVNRNLNVNGNITIGGTSVTLFTTELKVSDPDLVLGFRTDALGNDVSNDNTANHGGIAVASTEGSPLVTLYNPGIGESTLPTYKKIMWFKSGTFAGLNTDAWLFNYAVGIGSTQFPVGTRLAVGNVQFTQNDLAVVRNINASGIITATTFNGQVNAGVGTITTLSGTNINYSGVATVGSNLAIAGVTTTIHLNVIGFTTVVNQSITGVATVGSNLAVAGVTTTQHLNVIGFTTVINQSVTGVSTIGILNVGTAGTIINAQSGTVIIGGGTSTGTASQPLQVTGGAYVSGNLGIGTTNPQGTLQVNSGTSAVVVSAGGSIGIGLTNPTTPLDINKDSVTSTSDLIQIQPVTGTRTSSIRFANSGAADLRIGLLNSSGSYGGFTGGPAYAGFIGLGGGSSPLLFITSNTERARIFGTGEVGIGTTVLTGTSSQPLQVAGGAYVSGSVGIGTTNPSAPTHILYSNSSPTNYLNTDAGLLIRNNGTNGSTLKLESNANLIYGNGSASLIISDRQNERIRITSTGNVGIGTTNPTSTLTVQGNAYVTGVTTSTDFDSLSDINLKTNINQIADPLEKVMQIRGVTFDWKESNRGSAGVIAQEIEKVLPELVHGGETKTVNYNGLIGLLIECVKKQQEEIEQLKKLN